MAIRGILFDKDGTIIDYWRTWVPINRAAALYAAGGDNAIADALLRLGGHDPTTDGITPGSPLAAGDALDIAKAFASHPGIAPAERLVAGIDRIFCSGGAQHSGASTLASPPTIPVQGSKRRWVPTASSAYSTLPRVAMPGSAPNQTRAWCRASAMPSASAAMR